MAVKRKVKAKTKVKPKRRKVAAKRPQARRKPAPRVRKPAGKSAAKRPAPKRRAAPRAAKPKPQVAIAPAPAAPPGERIGVVTHYYGEPRVAVVKLESGPLRVGDTIHVRGHTTDFAQRVDSLQIEHAAVQEVGPDDDFGLKVVEHVREHDVVYKVK